MTTQKKPLNKVFIRNMFIYCEGILREARMGIEQPTVVKYDILKLCEEEGQRGQILGIAIKQGRDAKSLYPYVKAVLADWDAHGLTTPEAVVEYLKPKKEAKPKRVIREEMKPDWLNKQDEPKEEKPVYELTEERKFFIDNIPNLVNPEQWTTEQLERMYNSMKLARQLGF